MPSRSREDALSEVIGFILILALIAALASLYLTYVVPAQGREGEIKHMATINDQFLGYKTAIDSLWINDQTNVPISRTFTLGTLTGTTQGSFVIPIFQPYPSSGSMVVNGRGESISIQADSLVQGFPGNITPNLQPIYFEPSKLYFQILTTDTSKGGGVKITPTKGDWYILLNVSSVTTPSTASPGSIGTIPTLQPTPGNPSTGEIRDWWNNYLVPWASRVNSSMGTTKPILTMTMIKNGHAIFSNLVIVDNPRSNTLYTINLLDDAYGLASDTSYPFEINKPVPNSTSPWIITYYPVSVGYIPLSLYHSHQMGSLEYLSSNKYWIQQNYYYQQGGVFLAQPNDGMVPKVLPLISITNQTGIPTVRIVDITVKGSGNIGGTSPVQVISRLNSVSQNMLNGYTLAQGIPNAKYVTIIITAENEPTAQMWNRTFAAIKSTAGGQSWIMNSQNGNLATLTIDPFPSSSEYDIILDYTQVNLDVELQPVAT